MRHRLPACLQALACLLALAAPPAMAHKPSDAYLSLQLQPDGRVEQRLDIALRDLDRDLEIGTEPDGTLRWGALRERWAALEHLAETAVALQVNGLPCQRIARGNPALDTHVDGRYAVLRSSWACAPAPATLVITYTLFAATDPSHRGIARIDMGTRAAADATAQDPAQAAAQAPARDPAQPTAGTQTRVLVPGNPPTVVQLGAHDGTPEARGFGAFFAEGLHHIAVGADHLLFLVTLLLVTVWQRQGDRWAPRSGSRAGARAAWGEALRIVSAFTVAHSLTLGLAASGVLAPPSRWVESLIAASVLVAALDNLRPLLPGPRWAMAAMFGLVHGFGFAGPLQDLGLQGGALALPLLAFNLGVETGQLLVVALLLPLALAWRQHRGYAAWVVRPGSALVAGLALVWTLERALSLPLLERLI